MMRILVDENCDVLLVSRLRAAGHDVNRIVEIASGSDDESVLGIAVRERRVLFTHDLDFSLLPDKSDDHPPAIVLMRLAPLRAAARADVVMRFLADVRENYHGRFFVIEPGSVRERFLTGN